MKQMWADVIPMGTVRMTNRGKWVSEKAQRYLAYKDDIGHQLKQQWGKEPTIAACAVGILFYMPIPASWSKKKRSEANLALHAKKPDIDNLVKGLFDSANGIVWKDDNQIVRINMAEKRYSRNPGIVLMVEELF